MRKACFRVRVCREHSEEGMPPRDEVGSGEQAGLHVGVEGGGEQRERGGNRSTEGCRV